jgi:hypothetical protein
MRMKRKILILLASCSLALLIIVPVESIVDKPIQQMVQPMGHGGGGG